MARRYGREEIVERLRGELDRGRSLFAVVAGSGISAKFTEAGGADLIMAYGGAKFRMAGLSSMCGYLPIYDANSTVLEFGPREVFPVVKEAPVVAGLFGADPTWDLGDLLDQVARAGFSGVMNAPTLALVDGFFRQTLEETGISYEREVEMVALARERDLFTMGFASQEDEVEKMVGAGCDMLVIHLGNTIGGSIGSSTAVSRDEAAESSAKLSRLGKGLRRELLSVVHGGPISMPDDFRYLKQSAKEVDGFLAGSSAERLPVERGIRETAKEFKGIPH